MAKHQRLSASGKMERNPERFYCPYPNCTRSFAELWRLKVHYRAPPDARGSGKERGHGCELQQCPKCEKELKQGRHHVGCFANKGNIAKKRPQKVAEEPFADPEDFVGLDRHRSNPVPSPSRPPSGFRRDQKASAPTHTHPYSQAPRPPMSTAMSEPLQPATMKRKLPDEFAQHKRPATGYELHSPHPTTGSFLMGGRANTLPPPSAFEFAGQPEPIFKRFSSSSEDTPAAHEQRPGSAPELNQFTTLFDDDNWAGLLLAQVELQSEDFMLSGEGFGLPGDLALPSGSAPEPVKPQPAGVYQIQANCSTETFEDRKTSLDILSSRVLNVADDFPDVPHSLLGDMAPSLAPMHHRRAASCSIPQRSSADESIMMQGAMGPLYVGAQGSMAQQQQQQAQQQAQVLSMTSARSAPRPLDFPPYCSRANPALPTIHSFPSLDEICFSSDDSPIRITHGRYTTSSASSEYEDAELVHTEKTSVSRKGDIYELDIFSELEQSLDATFVFGAASMIGHSPQTPQEMYTNGKAGNAAARWSPQSEQTHAHGGC